MADTILEDSFWSGQHIIEACLASPYHRFMGAIAVEWLYTHNSYVELTVVDNQLNSKGRVPRLIDGIGVTTSGYPLLVKNIHYPCAKIVTTWSFGSDEIKCLEAFSSILHYTVQGKAIAVSNITKPSMVGTPVNHLCLEEYLVCPSHNFSIAPELTLCKSGKLEFNNRISYMVEQYTEVNSYMTKIGLHPLFLSISAAERTSHRNNPIHQLVEQRLSFPAGTCKQAHIQAAIGKNQGA